MSNGEIEVMKEDYLDSLQELTFNSKPIINNLTTIAAENVPVAQGIVKALEEHLGKCPPSYKLPALYLMDSICKNVGNPYNMYFGLQLYKTFTNTYTLVNEAVRRKMIDLFETWKRPIGDGGQMLFSNEQIRKIDGFVSKIRAKQQEEQRKQQAEHARQFMASGPMSANALLMEIDQLIDLTQQRQRYDPSVDAQQQLDILHQLRMVLSNPNSVDPGMLPTIQQQLATFNQKEVERLERISRQQTPVAIPPPANSAGVDLSKLFNSGLLPPQRQTPSAPPAPSNQGPIPLDLINGLKNAGFFTKSPTPQPGGAVAGFYVELSNQSLQQMRPNLISRLYDDLKEQCSTCGKRFQNSDNGRKEKAAHLDWHFRTNKRLREDNRQQNRCWYQTLEDWIKYRDEDEVLGLTDETVAKAEPKKPELTKEQLMEQYVIAPSSTKSKSCPLCKEKFAAEWNDKAEDWVWMNAVKVHGRILHATCHAEADEELLKKLARPVSSSVPPPSSLPPALAALTGGGGSTSSASLSAAQKQKPSINQDVKNILANLQQMGAQSKRKREYDSDGNSNDEKKVKIEQ